VSHALHFNETFTTIKMKFIPIPYTHGVNRRGKMEQDNEFVNG